MKKEVKLIVVLAQRSRHTVETSRNWCREWFHCPRSFSFSSCRKLFFT